MNGYLVLVTGSHSTEHWNEVTTVKNGKIDRFTPCGGFYWIHKTTAMHLR